MGLQDRLQLARMRSMLDGVFTVGVTGTKGKSSTTEFIAQLLEAQGLLTAVSTGVSSRIGTRYVEVCRTFDELEVFIRRSRRAVPDAFVVEMTSEALASGLNHGFDCDVAVLTNIGTDHVPTHGSMARYVAAKQRIFKDLAVWRGTPSPVAVLNADDPYADSFAHVLAPDIRLFTVGLTKARVRSRRVERHLTAANIEHRRDGTSFEVRDLPAGPVRVHTALFGDFNVRNVLTALAACLTRGPVHGIAEAVAALRPPAGRFDIVALPSHRTPGIVVDYAHTPESVDEALVAVRALALPGGRVHAVFGCGGNTWRRKRPLMGEAAARRADLVTITSDNARSEPAARIAADILNGVLRAERGRVTLTADRQQAIHDAVRHAAPGDMVALLGRGEERTLTIKGRRIALSDAREARRALLARTSSALPGGLPPLSGTAAVVVDATTGTRLGGMNDDSPHYPASLVKLMTLLVALEAIADGRCSGRERVHVSAYAAQTPHPRLACRAGANVPFASLLEALTVRSSNLAATAIAEHVGGAERAFVAAMNARAASLDLRNTRFANPHGLPHRHQYTTALDVARVLTHLLRTYPLARRLLSGDRITVLGRDYSRRVPALDDACSIVGVKTGFTWEAGYNIAAGWRVGRQLRVGVVLGASTRAASFNDLKGLSAWRGPSRATSA